MLRFTSRSGTTGIKGNARIANRGKEHNFTTTKHCRSTTEHYSSNHRALLSYHRALLSNHRALLSNHRALLSNHRALLSNHRALTINYLDTGTESAALKPANTRAHETMDKDDAGATPASSMTVIAGVNSSIIVLLVCLAIIRSMFRNGSVHSTSAIVFVLDCVCLANCALCVYLLLAFAS